MKRLMLMLKTFNFSASDILLAILLLVGLFLILPFGWYLLMGLGWTLSVVLEQHGKGLFFEKEGWIVFITIFLVNMLFFPALMVFTFIEGDLYDRW